MIMDVKTIEIQKETKIKSSISVIVNGEKHLMRHPSLKIQVVDEKPFEIRVKQGTDSSPVYTFEPKDNMLLQISRNWRLTKCFYALPVVLPLAFIYIKPLLGYGVASSIISLPLIFFLIMRKKFLAVSVVSEDNADMSDKCFIVSNVGTVPRK